jgi:hypothetical protein
MLNICYRLPIKTWMIRKENEKVCNQKKKEVQEAFRTEMGLLIDYVKPGMKKKMVFISNSYVFFLFRLWNFK